MSSPLARGRAETRAYSLTGMNREAPDGGSPTSRRACRHPLNLSAPITPTTSTPTTRAVGRCRSHHRAALFIGRMKGRLIRNCGRKPRIGARWPTPTPFHSSPARHSRSSRKGRRTARNQCRCRWTPRSAPRSPVRCARPSQQADARRGTRTAGTRWGSLPAPNPGRTSQDDGSLRPGQADPGRPCTQTSSAPRRSPQAIACRDGTPLARPIKGVP